MTPTHNKPLLNSYYNMENEMYDSLGVKEMEQKFDKPNDLDTGNQPVIIKAIGVGGGGGNAVGHMFRQGIKDVKFVVVNTDRQALLSSPVPDKVMIGTGRGVGGKPEKGTQVAEENLEKIQTLFDDGTCMAFITAGMGGGTGTGAAPIVAREAQKRGILTIGIVTIPYYFEGERKIESALRGADEMAKYVDSLLIINNERLIEIYGDLSFADAFAKSDDTLLMAARSISELITGDGYINLDFEDVKSTLTDGGAAIISTGYGEGESRVKKAISAALESPLLKNHDILGAQRLLFNLYYNPKAEEEFLMREMQEFTDFVQNLNENVEVIWGVKFDESLGNSVKVTILAAGFDVTIREEEKELFERHKPAQEQPKAVASAPATPESADIKNRINEEYRSSVDKYHNAYVILTPEQMDDELVIDVLEKNPAYNRDKRIVKDLETQIRQEARHQPAAAVHETSRSIDFM